jgi:response regulator RpfG family c-di-GMP phosphodiesterase
MSSPVEQNLVPIRVSTLKAGVVLGFDVFVHYKERYLLYKSALDLFEPMRLEQFKNHKIKKVFIKGDDEVMYLNYLEASLDALTKTDVSSEEKADLAVQTLVSEARHVEKNLETAEGLKKTESRVSKVIDYVSSAPDALKAMLTTSGLSVDNSLHSSTVASMSLALATKLKVTNNEELMALGIAALLHDSALQKLGFDAMAPESSFKGDQLEKWRTHPREASVHLSGKKHITPQVLRIIDDHHEVGDGLGFPEKKRISKLPLSSQVFNLCDTFDHFCVEHNIAPVDAFPQFFQSKIGVFELDHMQAMGTLLK